MTSARDIRTSLIDADDCVLAVIDIQDVFLRKYDKARAQEVVAKAAWLIWAAQKLEIPIVAMAEDIESLGPLRPEIADALPQGTPVHNKDSYGLAASPEILSAIKSSGRSTVVCIGMATDVCVSQSVLGLIENGYSVAAPQDAVVTTALAEEFGWSRMRAAGCVVTSVKALYYEWVRSVSRCAPLRQMAHERRPSSLVL